MRHDHHPHAGSISVVRSEREEIAARKAEPGKAEARQRAPANQGADDAAGGNDQAVKQVAGKRRLWNTAG